MEVNTVVISVERYETLRSAEKIVNKPRSKTIIIRNSFGDSYRVETDDECAEELANKLSHISDNVMKLRKEILIKDKTIIDLTESIFINEKMSWWTSLITAFNILKK
jgi:hypothetical protein